jgi:hypothetical protein
MAVWLSAFSFIAIEAESNIILTIEGQGDAYPILYTDLRIRSLPQASLSTFDPWDRQYRQYTGVKLLTLLEDIGGLRKTSRVEVISRNNYRASLEIDELNRYQYLLSYEMDGRPYAELEEGNKGPLAMTVTADDVSETERVRIKEQYVWWIERIVLR